MFPQDRLSVTVHVRPISSDGVGNRVRSAMGGHHRFIRRWSGRGVALHCVPNRSSALRSLSVEYSLHLVREGHIAIDVRSVGIKQPVVFLDQFVVIGN
jgi:hypothetical protein